ncbi:hypothetical protein [Acinetobacter baumannii]|nr:hypothetical protein [Acinetobacter baumannii]
MLQLVLQEKNKVSKEIGNVTQQGMGTLDKLMEAIQSNLEQSLKV